MAIVLSFVSKELLEMEIYAFRYMLRIDVPPCIQIQIDDSFISVQQLTYIRLQVSLTERKG